MSFVKLVRPSELKVLDIPFVETPFFAADRARLLVEQDNHLRSSMQSLFRYGSGDRREPSGNCPSGGQRRRVDVGLLGVE